MHVLIWSNLVTARGGIQHRHEESPTWRRRGPLQKIAGKAADERKTTVSQGTWRVRLALAFLSVRRHFV